MLAGSWKLVRSTSVQIVSLNHRTRQEAIALFPDHGITLATQLFQPRPVQYRDLATVVFDHTKLLQLAGGFGDAFTADAERMLLNDRLTQAIASAQRHRTSLAVLFLDVDHFKHINDSLGHAIGDQLLQSIAQRLVACVRHSDTVSRHGGDEFVVLLSEVTRAGDAASTATKILAAVSRPHRIGHQDLHVTVSVGIGVYPDDGADAEALLKNADIALFQAKARGRSNHQFFEPDMSAGAVEPANRMRAQSHG